MSDPINPPSPPSPPPPPSPALPPSLPEAPESVTIRGYPKVIFFYPVLLFSAIAWISQGVAGKDPAGSTRMGVIFVCIFAINLFLVSFEFTRMSTVVIFAFLVALVFAILFFNKQFPDLALLTWLGNLVHKIRIQMNTQFYAWMTILFLMVFGIMFLNSRFDYYEVRHNEILRHNGWMGDVERYPAPNLKMEKEIRDLLEYALLRSGRLVMHPTSESRAIVLENVIGINRVEKQVQQLLGRLAVAVEKGP